MSPEDHTYLLALEARLLATPVVLESGEPEAVRAQTMARLKDNSELQAMGAFWDDLVTLLVSTLSRCLESSCVLERISEGKTRRWIAHISPGRCTAECLE